MTRTIQQSYGGGRMSPDMLGRPEDVRVRSGLAEAANVRTTTSGAFESRTGFQFLAALSASRRSIVRPFVSSPTDAVAVVVTGWDGNPSNYGTMRFVVGGVLLPTGSRPAYWKQSGSMVWTISPLSAGTVIRVTVSTHGFTGNEPVRFTTSGALPGPLAVGVTYYVRTIVDANNFTLSYTPGGAEIPYDAITSPSGTPVVHRRYSQGDVVSNSGTTYTALVDVSAVEPGVTGGWASSWYAQGGTYFEVPHQYADAHLADLDMSSQEGATLTIAHQGYPMRELVRESATFWRLRTIVFGAVIPAPQWNPVTGVVSTPGEVYNVTAAANGGAPSRLILDVPTPHPYAVGEIIYVAGITGISGVADGFYVVGAKNASSTTVDLKLVNGGTWFAAGAGSYPGTGGTIRAASPSSIITNFYLLTSVDADNRESINGPGLAAVNNLEVLGSYNTLNWLAVSGAAYYRVYRFENGTYELLGETSTTTFRDDGDATDPALTVPFQDSTINGSTSDYPGAAALFEGRRWPVSTLAKPLGVWATRSGTSSDMTTHQTPLPDDRLSFVVKSQSSTINHAVPQSQTLLLLTDAEEIRVAALESGALTATDQIPARTITRNGSTKRRPATNGSTVVFENRGGRVLELGFRSDTGWSVQSLSERCGDWFDGYNLADGIAVQRAPIPTLWMVQGDGRLLGLTYAPEEAVAGWHEHTTDGSFESVCVVPEGREDIVYAVIQRTINGSSVRYLERMAERYYATLADRRFLDSFGTFDGTNTGATTLTLTGGTNWLAGETITLTASASTFAYPATTDKGDQIKWLGLYRVKITATSSATVATGVILDSFASAPAAPSTVWAWGRDTISGLGHLEGKQVQIVADGVALQPQTVVSGAVTLRTRAAIGSPSAVTVGFKVHVGLGYTAEAVTMPPAIPVDGLGHGRRGSVTHASIRMRRSAPFRVGPLGGVAQSLNLVQEADDFTGVSRELVEGEWSSDKQIRMVQTDPLPMVVTGAVYTVTWGG